MTKVYLAAALSLMASGCGTTLTSTTPDESHPATGPVYYLPKTQVLADVAFELKECERKQIGSDYFFDFQVSQTVSLSTASVPDETQRYFIDPADLHSGNKATSLVIEFYENQSVKSINAKSDDKTDEIIISVITGVAKIASAAIGVPGVRSGVMQTASAVCTTDAVNALKLLKSDKAVTKGFATALEPLQNKLAIIQARSDAGNSPNPAADAAEMTKLKAQIAGLNAQLLAHQKKVAAASALLTYKTSIRTSGTFVSNVFSIDENIQIPDLTLGKWITNDGRTGLEQQQSAYRIGTTIVPNQANVHLYARGQGAAVQKPQTDKNGKIAGLVVRSPITIPLSACSLSCLRDSRTNTLYTPADRSRTNAELVPSHDQIAFKYVEFSQAGLVSTLALKNKAFQDNSIVAQFSQSGVLTRYEFTSNAEGAAAAKTFENAASIATGAVSDVRAFKEGRRLADLNKQSAELKAEIERNELQKKLLDSQRALTEE